jgi:hypothetical protein
VLCAAVLVACGGGGSSSTDHPIGGRVEGLTGAGLVLRNNGVESLSVPAAGRFRFVEPVPNGANYAVSVATQPSGQTCSVANGSGTATRAVDDIVVTCQTAEPPPPPPPNTYAVGGNVAGLKGSGLVLQNNGGNDLAIASDGAFAFTTRLAAGAAYAVSVATQPGGQRCDVSRGSGTVANANITNVAVACQDVAPPPPPPQSYTVGGSVAGLASAGLVLQNNGGDGITVPSGATAFTFPTALAEGRGYDVRVATQPQGNDCAVTQGAGSVGNANVTSVRVSCGPIAPLAVLSATPANNTNEVPRNVVPTMTFSAALDPASLSASRLFAFDGASQTAVNHTASAQGAVLSIQPQRKLLPNVLHYSGSNIDIRGTRGERLPNSDASLVAFTTADAAWTGTPTVLGASEVAGATAASNRYGDTLLAWVEFGQGGSTLVLARQYSAATGQWGEPLELASTTGSGQRITQPVASVTDSGDAVVAWVATFDNAVFVVARHRAGANGTLTPPVVVGSGAGIGKLALAAQANDEVDLLWTTSGSVQTAHGRIYDASAWQEPRVLATAQSSEWSIPSQISFAVLPDGGAMVVWEEYARSNRHIAVRARRLDANGVPAGVEPSLISVAPGIDFSPSAAAQKDDGGNRSDYVTVAWLRAEGTEHRILARRWNAGTDTWDTPLTLAAVNAAEREMGAPTVVAAPGRWGRNRPTQVVWGEANPDNGVFRLRGVALPSPTGAPEAAVTLVADTEPLGNNPAVPVPRAVADRAGNLLVVYEHPLAYDPASGAFRTELRSLRRQGRTGLWSSAALPTTDSTTRKRPQLVSADETGSAWAFWVSVDPSKNQQIVGRPFD